MTLRATLRARLRRALGLPPLIALLLALVPASVAPALKTLAPGAVVTEAAALKAASDNGQRAARAKADAPRLDPLADRDAKDWALAPSANPPAPVPAALARTAPSYPAPSPVQWRMLPPLRAPPVG